MLDKYITEKRAFLAVVIFAVIFLIIPNLIRFAYFDNYMLGEVPYYHAKIAGEIMQEKVNINNDYQFNPYNYLLAFFGSYLNILTATNLIPFIAGVLSTIFFYFILREFKFTIKQTSLIVLFWIISPLYIYSFTVSNPFSIIILLNLSGFYFLIKKRLSWISIPILSLIPLFGVQHAILTILLLFFYSIKNKEKLILCTSIILILFTISAGLIYFDVYDIQKKVSFEEKNLLQDNIVGIGALLGFNIFTIILAMIGLVRSWKSKHIFASLYIILILLFSASYYINSQFKIILNIMICLYAGLGMIAIVRMQWEQKLIRNLTIIILVLGIVFSSLSYVQRLSFMDPDLDLIDNLVWLRENSRTNEVVLSHYKNGYWIEYFSGRPASVKSNSEFESYNETLLLFKMRNEENALELMNRYDIKYIFVDRKTLDLMMDENNRIGLGFLMDNSADFEKVKDGEEIDIWKYERS